MNKTLPDDFISNASLTRPSRTLAGCLMTIALVWLLMPTSSYQLRTIALEPAHLAQATQQWRLGIGSASWVSLNRQGTGPMAQGRRGVDWGPAQLEFHPHWITAAPLGLLLLAGLMVAPAGSRHLDAVLHSLKQTAKPLGHSAARGVTVGLLAVFVLALALPSTNDAILERPDAEQIKMRLNAQLGEDGPRFRLRLEQPADGPAHLVIRRYTWNHFHPDPFGPLVQATELERGDLRHFRFPLNPAVMPLALGAMLLAFGITLRRRLREQGSRLNPASS